VHVGEWLGDTGSPAFEQALADGWEMQLRLPLPCWGDTVEDLSIWRRRPQQSPKQNPKQSPKQKEPKPAAAAGAATVHPTLKCDECGKEGTLRPPQKRAALALLGERVRELEQCGHLPHLDQPALVDQAWVHLCQQTA